MPDAPSDTQPDNLNDAAAPSTPGERASSPLPASLTPPPPGPGPVAGAIAQVAAALRFFSVLPLPQSPDRQTGLAMATAPLAVAAAGVFIGIAPALVLVAAAALDLPALLAAAIAIVALVLITGALHEDGLADTADGLAGGATTERRLEIMRDSRSGAFGVTALVLSLLLRVAAVAALAERLGAGGAALAVIAVAATSRVAALLPLAMLQPARPAGLGTAAGRPAAGHMSAAAGACLAATIALLWPSGVLVAGAAFSVAAAFAGAWIMARIARARIGGHTGDIAGAAQQLAEIAMLVLLTAFAAPAVVL
jgi:adenosylcobinamide-GDP ribazoletransferase